MLLAHHGSDSLLAEAIGDDRKGKMSLVIYFAAIGLTFVHPYLGVGLYALVALIWLKPDSRIEKVLKTADES